MTYDYEYFKKTIYDMTKIDLNSYKEGEYEVPVMVTLPEGYTSLEEVNVKLKLVKAAEVTEKNETEENE